MAKWDLSLLEANGRQALVAAVLKLASGRGAAGGRGKDYFHPRGLSRTNPPEGRVLDLCSTGEADTEQLGVPGIPHLSQTRPVGAHRPQLQPRVSRLPGLTKK